MPETSTETPRVTVEQLNERLQSGQKVTVVDVRRGSYATSDEKVPGAIRIDPERYQEDFRRLPQGASVVTYCT
ncbi:MAG: hypothetical protein ABR599_12340 [Gemmatimonadota bacterium]